MLVVSIGGPVRCGEVGMGYQQRTSSETKRSANRKLIDNGCHFTKIMGVGELTVYANAFPGNHSSAAKRSRHGINTDSDGGRADVHDRVLGKLP
jgi:hypothetical protein